MKSIHLVWLALSLVSVSACDSDTEQEELTDEALEFTTLYQTPARDAGGTTLEGISKSFRIFRTQDEFDLFKNMYPFFGNVLNQNTEAQSQINFENGVVIMAYLGEKGSAGYSVEIADINLSNDGYALVSIESEMGAPACPQDGAITYPMHLIYIQNKSEIVFKESMSVYSC